MKRFMIMLNGHGKCAALNNETRGARFPLSSSLPQAGERDSVSLREFHVKAAATPYVLDLQSDLLEGLKSRVVAPLRLLSSMRKAELIQDLMPIFSINGKKYVLVTQEMAGFPLAQMGKVVADLTSQNPTILNALDRLLSS